MPPDRAAKVRVRISRTVLPRQGLSDWPCLPPPATLGTVTVTVANVGQDIEGWADAVWTAWADHHDTVRRWAQAV